MTKLRLLLALLPLGLAPGAEAAVIIDLAPTQLVSTNTTYGAATGTFQAQIVLSDAAYANGFSFTLSNSRFGFLLQGSGVLDFTASISGGMTAPRATFAQYTTPLPPQASGQSYSLSASGGAGGPVSGSIGFNNTSSDFAVSFSSATGFSGNARTDGDFVGCFAGPCTFASRVLVAVPEPSSLAVLALAGVAATVALRRRRRAAD